MRNKQICNPFGPEQAESVAVCVGVEDYSHISKVGGAIKSVTNVFDALTAPESAICSSEKSKLLLNPSYGEFHRFLESYTYLLKPIDNVIFYFCGRTDLVNKKTVLCLRDSVKLRQNVVNPFTVQGWQAFFQLAEVAQVKSVIFLLDAFGSSSNDDEAKQFIRSLKMGRESGLPMSKHIEWGMVADFTPLSESVEMDRSDVPSLFSRELRDILNDPPKHTIAEPYIPLRSVIRTLQKKMKTSKYDKKRWYEYSTGGLLAVCRNPKARVRIERFIPHYVEILTAFANLAVGEYNAHEVLHEVSPAAWTIVNKLSYDPWKLIADGSKKGLKKITRRGRGFLRGTVRVPLNIFRKEKKWEPYGREMVDIKYFKAKKLNEKKEQEDLTRQMDLFP